MEFKDYYSILGVASTASKDEIKKSYRRLARKYHPDVSKEKDAEARFKALSEAYEVLSDASKRAEYDQIRSLGAGRAYGSGARSGQGDEEMSRQFGDFFESMFGGMGKAGGGTQGGPFQDHRSGGWRGSQRRRGRDLAYKLALFLEEA